VVVRRVLPGETGPSGGPAMTDVLGTLVSWGSGTCVVSPESGPAVAIRVDDIVTGKPVPPRASVRRRVSVRDAEIRALPLWLSPETEPLGEWVLRVVTGERGRGSRRANSGLAVGDPGLPLLDAADAVRGFYARYGRVATVQVESGSDVDATLVDAGWSESEPEDAPFLVGSLVMALRAAGSAGDVEASVDDTRVAARLVVDGVEVARGRGELNAGWLGVHGLRVDEAHRRSGLGRAVMAGLLEVAAEEGADTLWLEVDRLNTPAWMLYAGLGLHEHHLCRYLQAPPS
jgi:ribosomal protein S18 acetylase RimI-like enzyme